jgi:hypothetical protein
MSQSEEATHVLDLSASSINVFPNPEVDIESKFYSFKCFLNSSDVHFLYEPRILPCSNSACLDCIKKLLDPETHILKCSFCKADHKIEEASSLETNQNIVDQINQNWNEISDELLSKLDNQVDGLKSNKALSFRLNSYIFVK